jgi:Nucleotide modification associated domain 3
MKAALLRVGIDSGSGGIQGPLFKDGTFEFIPIPKYGNRDPRTYGNIIGRHGKPLIEYFPKQRQAKMADHSMHVDPEFETYTYGDPTPPKSSLKNLEEGDMLIFYCGLHGWDFKCEPALYLIGYFEVLKAGIASDFDPKIINKLFNHNYHVMHQGLFHEQKDRLVLVKGSDESRLLNKAVLISTTDQDKAGKPLKILSPEMRKIFGTFNGKLSIQRSPPRG